MKLSKLLICATIFSGSLSVAYATKINDEPYPTNALMPGNYNTGAWVYDTIFSSTGDKIGDDPGKYLDEIQGFNNKATQHGVKQIYAYGSDLEMYCKGSGESNKDTPCTAKNMVLYYTNDNPSVTDYAKLTSNNNPVQNIIIIDGRVDVATPGSAKDYLDSFNILDKTEANTFADKVAYTVCNDDKVDGVQFDIEPFSFTGANGAYTGSGQEYFYDRIAEDFASTTYNCKNTKHPYGRIFSVFTFASAVTPEVAATFTKYHNGYIVDSLYDLKHVPGGTAEDVAEFKQLAEAEVNSMKEIGDKYNLPYKFGVPAAASVHEFEAVRSVDGVTKNTGYKQSDYVQAAFDIINNANLTGNINYKGIDIWAWSSAMWWTDTTIVNAPLNEYLPAQPSDDTSKLLEENL